MTFGNQQGIRNVSLQDEIEPVVDLHLTREIDSGVLRTAGTLNSETIEITISTLPVVGDLIILKDPTGDAFFQGGITAVTPIVGNDYDLDLDTPLDFAFQTDAILTLESNDMAVDGSVTIQEFKISPVGLAADVEWHVLRVLASLLSDGQMDDGLFGNLPPLTNGFVLRSENGFTKNIFNARTNGEVREHVFDFEYADKAPAGLFGLSYRRAFGGQDKNGIALRIAVSEGEGFKCLIQDDLTGLTAFRMVAQGHTLRTGIGL